MVRILIADTSIVARRDLRILFKQRPNFEVCVEANNGRDAIELARHHKPDVAILEISLPIVDGISATHQIRRQTSATEVMIFTLRWEARWIRDAIDAGARGYVLKSEANDQVVKAVEVLACGGAFFSGHLSNPLWHDEHERSYNHAISLTSRERDVVRLIAEGKSNKAIACLLDISIKTVETHRSASMRKLDVHSSAELVRHAIRYGLILP
jgi:DNA-binding NarL/FixJ family response regulator